MTVCSWFVNNASISMLQEKFRNTVRNNLLQTFNIKIINFIIVWLLYQVFVQLCHLILSIDQDWVQQVHKTHYKILFFMYLNLYFLIKYILFISMWEDVVTIKKSEFYHECASYIKMINVTHTVKTPLFTKQTVILWENKPGSKSY